MSTIVRIQDKGQVTIPTRLRTRAGLAKGDLVEAAFVRGRIVLTPKVAIDKSRFPHLVTAKGH
ncbi:MAG: AbrB/MazE/SpoVT family DNA-binding domain-containing protein [Bryobacteraceae bacterium]|jgi:AbrB family looped-hinge helix DNA binding protein